MKIPSIKALPLIGVENIYLVAAIPRKNINKVAIADDFKEIHSGEKSNTIFYLNKNIIKKEVGHLGICKGDECRPHKHFIKIECKIQYNLHLFC